MKEKKIIPRELNDELMDKVTGGTDVTVKCKFCGKNIDYIGYTVDLHKHYLCKSCEMGWIDLES